MCYFFESPRIFQPISILFLGRSTISPPFFKGEPTSPLWTGSKVEEAAKEVFAKSVTYVSSFLSERVNSF